MSTSAVLQTIRPDRIAVLSLDQSGSRANILSQQLWTDLETALLPLRQRTDLAGLILSSAKPGIFIAGADLKFFLTLSGANDPACRELIEHGLRVLNVLESLPFPTCAAIDGAALGGGLEVALACDFRVCGTSPRVELGLPEVKLGLIPGWGGTQRLPRIVGLKKAAGILVTGTSLTVEVAETMGLVNRIVSSESLIDTVATWLAELGRLPEQIVNIPTVARTVAGQDVRARVWEEPRRVKHQPIEAADRVPAQGDWSSYPAAVQELLLCITRGAELPLAEALKIETEAFLRLAGSDESKRLITEFFASRKKG